MRGRGTRLYAPLGGSAGPSGAIGPATTVAAASRRSLSGHCFAMPCRPVDELHQAAGSAAHVPRFRPPDRRTPGPHRHPESLHHARHPRHTASRLTSHGETGSLDVPTLHATAPGSVPWSRTSTPPPLRDGSYYTSSPRSPSSSASASWNARGRDWPQREKLAGLADGLLLLRQSAVLK